MFREGRPISTRKQEEKVRKDPLKTRRPDLPVSGPGKRKLYLLLFIFLLTCAVMLFKFLKLPESASYKRSNLT